MSNTIRAYFENAQLSMAAYATLDVQMNTDKTRYKHNGTDLRRSGISTCG